MCEILCGRKFSFCWDTCLGRRVQDHIVSICLVFKIQQLAGDGGRLANGQIDTFGNSRLGEEPMLTTL